MDSAVGKFAKKPNKAVDRSLLLIASLLVAGIGVAVFWLADDHHINPAWLFAAGAALVFFIVVGRDYRERLKSPQFVLFFIAWLLVHVLVFLLVLGHLGFLWYLPFVVLELWIGYTLAIRIFGLPSRRMQ